jgi:outer membrane protein TolC
VFKYLSPITSDVLPQNIAYVGVDISWDVFDWGKKQQDLAQLRRASEQARNSVADTASQIVLDVNSAFRKLEDSQAFLAVAETGQEAAREQLRVVTNQYRHQAALLKDVLAAQASLGQANDQYRQAALGFWEARANLDRALGTDE